MRHHDFLENGNRHPHCGGIEIGRANGQHRVTARWPACPVEERSLTHRLAVEAASPEAGESVVYLRSGTDASRLAMTPAREFPARWASKSNRNLRYPAAKFCMICSGGD